MKIHFLQALRAVAAWLVVLDHALVDVTAGDVRNPATQVAWMMGSIGVSVFFVISGFIMVHISWDDFGRRGAAANFLRRRIIRIVPLYWLATIAAFAFHKVSATHGADAGWLELLQSLLFIPYRNEAGGWAPVLSQGWTLNYEMFFYAILAVALVFRRSLALPGVGAALAIFTLVGLFFPSGVWAYLSSPIVLLFVMGIGLAMLWRSYGLVEPKRIANSAKVLEAVGDASYAIYLVHGLALTILLRIWVKLAGPPSLSFIPFASFVVLGLAAATVVGLCVHLAVEKPILRIATGRWKLSGSLRPLENRNADT
jgi:exopolysaccharide production protein ExoZ